MQLIGQIKNIELIEKWGKLPNFIIIQGPEHTGKSYLTLYLCQLFKLQYVKVQNNVDEIRNLISVMVPNSNTLYHLDNFDGASLQAKNALLKVTEEPVPGNYIVITGGPQIKTLQSRARIIIMAPYSFEELSLLYENYYPNIDAKKLYNAGINTPAKIEFYKDYEGLEELLANAYKVFERITYIEPQDYIPLLKLFDTRYDKNTVDLCMLFINMLIHLIENKMKEKKFYSYYEILNLIMIIKNQLRYEYTLNRRFLILKLFYQIQQLHEKGKDI